MGVGSRDETLEGGNCGWRGYRGGRDDQATAKLRQAVGHQWDKADSRGWGRGGMINGGRDQWRREQPRARRVQRVEEGERRGFVGWCSGPRSPGTGLTDLAARRQKRRRTRRQRDQKVGERLQVDGRKRRDEERGWRC